MATPGAVGEALGLTARAGGVKAGSEPFHAARMSMSDDLQYLYLSTTGRRTGFARETEIWFTRQNGRYYVISEQYDHAQWVQNLIAEPRVSWRVGTDRLAGKARVVDGRREPGLVEAVQGRSREKYGWGEGLVVELIPD